MGNQLSSFAGAGRGKLAQVAGVCLAASVLSMATNKSTGKRKGTMDTQAKQGRGRTKKFKVGASFYKVLRKVLKEALGARELSLIGILATSLLARSYLSVWIAGNMGQSIQHFCRKDWKRVGDSIYAFGVSTVMAAGVNAALKWLQSTLADSVRERLTMRAHVLYMQRMNYYGINHVGDDKLENCDQLICDDIKKFSTSFAEVYSQSLKPTVDFCLFSLMMSRMMGLEGPFGMYTWFFVAVAISTRVVPPYGVLAAHLQLLEGRFRARHVALVQNAEMVAFMAGERPEVKLLDNAYQFIKRHTAATARSKFYADFIQGYVNKYLASVVGFALTTRPVLINHNGMGSWDEGQIASYYVKARQIMESLSNAVLALFELQKRVGLLKGLSARVGTLFDCLKQRSPLLLEQIEASRLTNPATVVEDQDVLEFEHVDIYKPDGVLLLKDLNITVAPGVRVIVTGDNGCGKSSLFRVMCGLWPLVAGTLRRPDNRKVYFLSQVNFVPVGSLREVMTYPQSTAEAAAAGCTDEKLQEILEWAHLKGFKCDGVHPALDDVLEWTTALSPGQKQRMAFARLLYARPQFAVLDECTNGIAPKIEADLYNRLSSLGMAIFSISHKIELKKHHDFELHFNADADGTYEWIDLSKTT